MNLYLVGSSQTQEIEGYAKITEQTSAARKANSQKHIVEVAVNGGPGTGKGSFEEAVIRELTAKDENRVAILVAEAARDVITELKEKDELDEVLKSGKIGERFSQEQRRRRAIAEELAMSFERKTVFVLYDRDESNARIYDLFFQYYNPESEELDKEGFSKALGKDKVIHGWKKELRKQYDVAFCLEPVQHEINYACANPKVEGAKVDPIRAESFKQAQAIHAALEKGAERIYGKKLVVVPNTDTEDATKTQETIAQRAQGQVERLERALQKKEKPQIRVRITEFLAKLNPL